MQINEIFIVDTSDKSKVWIDIIKKIGDPESLNALDNLDVSSWALAGQKRDELSYYHGKKRAKVHLGNCYQEVLIQLLIKTLAKKGIDSSLVSYSVDGFNSKLMFNNIEIESVNQVEDLILKTDTETVKTIYKNEIFALDS